MQKYCSTLKFVCQEFDAKLRYNFRKMLQNATLEVGEGFEAFHNVYRTSQYFFNGLQDQQSARHSDLASIGFVACFVDERQVWKLSVECKS